MAKTMTKKQAEKILKGLDIDKINSMKKAELVELIEAAGLEIEVDGKVAEIRDELIEELELGEDEDEDDEDEDEDDDDEDEDEDDEDEDDDDEDEDEDDEDEVTEDQINEMDKKELLAFIEEEELEIEDAKKMKLPALRAAVIEAIFEDEDEEDEDDEDDEDEDDEDEDEEESYTEEDLKKLSKGDLIKIILEAQEGGDEDEDEDDDDEDEDEDEEDEDEEEDEKPAKKSKSKKK